jgi:hypothetical protein
MADRASLIVPSQAVVGQWLASFNLDEVMQTLTTASQGSGR